MGRSSDHGECRYAPHGEREGHHFSCFALFTESAAVVTSTEAPASVTTEPATSADIPTFGDPGAGSLPWMTILVVCIVVGVVAGGVYYLKKE
ncbi:hypothetical protein L0665_04185 [Methanogenium marinum]|uniref:Uncharacterized protein n=1 Tax=Methanogenium marinum TaxID=348610 RepID=A0A9Q4PVA6_9EURY|nr:hypothetical protein [Methanogenium marinum]MDE4907810.1 hypothetical protein [Methanogenium marinum]